MACLDAKRTRSNAGMLTLAIIRLEAFGLRKVGSSEPLLPLRSGGNPVRHQPISDRDQAFVPSTGRSP